MLLLSKLDEVPARFAGYVEEVRDYLSQHGMALGSADSLPALCSRLRADGAFCRDVSSMVWAVAVEEAEEASSMDLLGVLVVAAASTKVNVQTEPQEVAVRELLRFVMHARRAEPRSIPVTVTEQMRPGSVESSPPLMVKRTTASPATPTDEKGKRAIHVPEPIIQPEFRETLVDLDEVEEAPWWRSRAAIWVGIVGAVLGLGPLWMGRRQSAPVNTADVTQTASEASRARETSPTVLGGTTHVIVRAHRIVRSPKLIPVRRASRARTDARSLAFASSKARLGINASGPVYASGTSTPPADAKAAPILRTPAAPASAAAAAQRISKDTSPGAGASGSLASKPPIDPYAVRPLLRRVTGGQPDEVEAEPEERMTPEGGVVRPQSTGMMASNVYYSPAPLYPPAASAAGVQGEVTVRATVDTEGNVTDARVVSGPAPLRDAALEAVQHWRYRPYSQNGRHVAVQTTAVVDFQLPE